VKKKPRFFCDNCGYEVGDNVKVCPYCGRNFVSIRCPVCDYSGPDRMFQSGCPMCGYSAPPPEKIKQKKTKSRGFNEHVPAEPLSFKVFAVTFLVVVALIALFSYLITR